MLTEDLVQELLKTPGARRGATGVLIPTPNGGMFHVQNMRKNIPGFTVEEHDFERFCSVKEVVRLRELKTAHDYLLRLRAKALVDAPRQLRVMDRRRDAVEAKGRSWSLTAFYGGLDRSAKRYTVRLSRQHQTLIRPIPVGLAPVREPNALCLRSVTGDVIVASESLRLFFYFMVMAAHGGAYGFNRRDQVDAALIALRLMIGSEALDFDLDPRAVLEPKIEASIQGQVDWLMEFTFGHEFGHLVMGHLATETPKLGDAELQAYAHEMEYAADLHAVRAVSDRKAGLSISSAGYNVLLFLHFIELVGETRTEVPNFSLSSTHPAPLDRLRALREGVSDKGQPDRGDLGLAIREMRRLRDDVCLVLSQPENSNVLTIPGSIHIMGLNGKPGRDRIDF